MPQILGNDKYQDNFIGEKKCSNNLLLQSSSDTPMTEPWFFSLESDESYQADQEQPNEGFLG